MSHALANLFDISRKISIYLKQVYTTVEEVAGGNKVDLLLSFT